MPSWKRFLLRSAGFGAGFALALCIIVGGFAWYNERPKLPKAWNRNAITAAGAPGFGIRSDHKYIELSYSLLNTTKTDYKIDSDTGIKLMLESTDGAFSHPQSKESVPVRLPIFIPAEQKGTFTLSLLSPDVPQRNNSETDEEYHERLRAYLDHKGNLVASFVVFDEANRYQIDLPRWLSKRPPKEK